MKMCACVFVCAWPPLVVSLNISLLKGNRHERNVLHIKLN